MKDPSKRDLFFYFITLKNPGYILLLLVLSSLIGNVEAQTFPDRSFRRIYNLEFDTAYLSSDNPYSILADNQEDFLFLILTDNPEYFEKFQTREGHRKKAIDNSTGEEKIKEYCRAELELQWSLLHWRFGDYVKSGFLLRKAYKRLEQIQSVHPDFVEVNKSLGLLHILLSAIPSEYDWIIKLFGFENNQARGLKELQRASLEHNNFQSESRLLMAYVNIFVLNHEKEGLALIDQIRQESLLNAYAYLIICNKSGLNEQGLNEIYDDRWIYSPDYLRPSLSLLRGEFHLKKLEYQQAIFNLKNFLLTYNGRSFRDNARLKLFFAYFLNQEKKEAEKVLHSKYNSKSDFSTSDLYAQNVFSEGEYPDSTLLKARLLFDGGYYEKALNEISKYPIKSSIQMVWEYEYYYRLARIHQRLGNSENAVSAFKKCIETQGDKNYYFAPNACLQLGRIYRKQNNSEEALKYFEKALDYKKYPYRRSIEHQARAAINEIH
jgi:tetratricopeptide (TPR) repeat protein